MEERFVAEPMLGKLAKWLRMIGCDAVYQRSYGKEDLLRLTAQGRRLLTRRADAQTDHPQAIVIRSDHVGEQLRELRDLGCLEFNPAKYFTRCLRCNAPLRQANPEVARSSVPDFVFHENPSGIRCCPGCGRFFWPGTHRDRMLKRLKDWGL